MTTQNRSVDEDNTLWFFMSRSGEPVAALALVKVTIVRAHYWDVKFSKIVQLYDIAKAAITDVQRQRKKLPARLLPLVPPAALQ